MTALLALKVGDTIENGSKLLRIQTLCKGIHAVVLCDTQGEAAHQFATWEANTVGPGYHTYWGHYFDDREEAERDFEKRVLQLSGSGLD